ncbi:NADH pyrophosphatase [Sphingomonas sp. Root710]|uniref:NAD(+) diphosphatase n=1 Tax=Sphingomonas sp. Root710 TaxID=1736594 RepID=UPI0006F531B1|nr:NAD(+) diphosphatase [Sphingomonas sp. Root710]KRB85433.1 NADH pyrophosphatase [Sphingomonas sp. Root710]
MADIPTPGFTGSPLVRIDIERDNRAYFDQQLGSLSARLLRLDGLTPQVTDDGRLSWGSLAEADPEADLALLGLLDGKPRFVSLARVDEDPAQRNAAMNTALTMLEREEAATYAAARCLVDWHSRHAYCARCGQPSRVFRSGWARQCARETGGCGTEHFPRTDPVVIMLAEYEGRVLVGRQHRWPKGRYSALAGFIEVGESIEEAVARELHEEAGVVVSDVRYVASQPWPFPSQLMIACIARAESSEISLDANELEHALWATRDDIRAALEASDDAPFLAPPPYAIAHTLLSTWLSEG